MAWCRSNKTAKRSSRFAKAESNAFITFLVTLRNVVGAKGFVDEVLDGFADHIGALTIRIRGVAITYIMRTNMDSRIIKLELNKADETADIN